MASNNIEKDEVLPLELPAPPSWKKLVLLSFFLTFSSVVYFAMLVNSLLRLRQLENEIIY